MKRTGVSKSPFLVGEDIHLRALTEQDCRGPYLNWFNDAEVCRFNGHHRFPFRREEALRYVKKVLESPTDLVLAVVLKRSRRHIGNVSLQKINFIDRSAELAIVIGEKDCWGKGYSKQVGRLLLEHAFLSLNLHRVHCGTTEENIPMQRLALYLGMKKEGVRRKAAFKENRYLDIWEYGILKPEYLKRFHGKTRPDSR